ncbi:MAG: propionyl-CoA carboxylase [Alphaproteobacteria bacterium]|nr:MAG: propionyl-CoA carboxylase [Alphaproteobacteria bacterium]
MSWDKEVDEIHERRKWAKIQGGDEGVALQHAKGRLTIRERIDIFTQDGAFKEHAPSAGEAIKDENGKIVGYDPANYVVGLAEVGGRTIAVGGEDFSIRGGSPNASGLRKSVYMEEIALEYKVPLVRFMEGGGGSVKGASGKGRAPAGNPAYTTSRFASIAEVLGEVPVACAAMGPVAGLPAARLVASHFSVMTEKTSQVLIAGPKLVERALGEDLTKDELGGPDVHLKNGVVDNLAADEADAIAQIHRFLSYMPQNVHELPPVTPCDDPADRAEEALLSIVPRDRRKPFNMRKTIKLIVDKDSFFETGRKCGPGQIVGLARLGGRPVGIFANDCHFYAGAMTAEGAQKVRRFIDMCNTFHLPIIALVDEPGFMIGSDSEKAATIRHGTAALTAAVQSKVPWASVMVRKAYGVAAAVHFGAKSYTLSWPSVESGALPIEGGVAVAYGRQIAEAEDPEAMRRELEEKHASAQSPFTAAENFSVHDLIDPRETRAKLNEWLDWSWPKLKFLTGPYQTTYRP